MQTSEKKTVAALARRAETDPSVEIVVVPDTHHLRDQDEPATPARRIRVFTLR
ncbi:hypothetical protein ACQPZ2_11325 [Nocardia pseudovaccinii]|uniref:hypothetical protein n=1 Tax=Nocardia pseudovaccinii TaxID=189540 RepID=UPI003D8E08A3